MYIDLNYTNSGKLIAQFLMNRQRVSYGITTYAKHVSTRPSQMCFLVCSFGVLFALVGNFSKWNWTFSHPKSLIHCTVFFKKLNWSVFYFTKTKNTSLSQGYRSLWHNQSRVRRLCDTKCQIDVLCRSAYDNDFNVVQTKCIKLFD